MAEGKKRKSLIALVLLALFVVGVGVFVVRHSGRDETSTGSTGTAANTARAPSPAPTPAPTPTAAENPTPTASATDLAQEGSPSAGDHGSVGSSRATGSGSGSSGSGRSLASSRSSGSGSGSDHGSSSDSSGSSSKDKTDKTATNNAKEAPPSDTASAEPAPPSSAPTGKVTLKYQNSVGNDYRLVRLVCVIDGETVATKVNPQIPPGTTAAVYSGPVSVGGHKVGVFAEYQGNGGMFSYFAGYKFKVQSAKSVSIAQDRTSTIVATAVERGGPTVAFEDRLALNVSVR